MTLTAAESAEPSEEKVGRGRPGAVSKEVLVRGAGRRMSSYESSGLQEVQRGRSARRQAAPMGAIGQVRPCCGSFYPASCAFSTCSTLVYWMHRYTAMV